MSRRSIAWSRPSPPPARTRWPARLRYELTTSEQADAFRIQREWVADDQRRDPTFQSTKDTHLGEIEMGISASRAGIGAARLPITT